MLQVIQEYLLAHAAALRDGNLVGLGVLLARDVLIVFSIASVAVVLERIYSLPTIARIEERDYPPFPDAVRDREIGAVRGGPPGRVGGPGTRAQGPGVEGGREVAEGHGLGPRRPGVGGHGGAVPRSPTPEPREQA